MEFGAHLPLMDFGGHPYTLDHLLDYTKAAARLGFTTLCANDHLVFSVPWLDGPTALAVAIRDSGTMTLATTASLAQPGGPPIWIGSWGSDAGLRRVARLGDGWLASAYNTTPELFTEARARLEGY